MATPSFITIIHRSVLLILTIRFVRNRHFQFCSQEWKDIFLTHPSSITHSKHIRNFNDTSRSTTKLKHSFLGSKDRLGVKYLLTWGVTWGVNLLTGGESLIDLGCRIIFFTPSCTLQWLFAPYSKIPLFVSPIVCANMSKNVLYPFIYYSQICTSASTSSHLSTPGVKPPPAITFSGGVITISCSSNIHCFSLPISV